MSYFFLVWKSFLSRKIHEVLIETNLVVKKKNLPSDAFYKAVLIRQSRRKSTVNDANDDSDYDDIVDSDD